MWFVPSVVCSLEVGKLSYSGYKKTIWERFKAAEVVRSNTHVSPFLPQLLPVLFAGEESHFFLSSES